MCTDREGNGDLTTLIVISSVTYILLATGVPSDFFLFGFDQNCVSNIVCQMDAVFPACIDLETAVIRSSVLPFLFRPIPVAVRSEA